jgi:hypothetical protein
LPDIESADLDWDNAEVREPVHELRRVVAALAVELPGEVWDDVKAKVDAVLNQNERLREWKDKTLPIIAALAIYEEKVDVASLAAMARELNEVKT